MSAPESYDLTSAARAVVEAEDGENDLYRQGAYAVWQALTGLPADADEACAREVAAAPRMSAICPPF